MAARLYRFVSPLGFLAAGLALLLLPVVTVPLGPVDDFGHLATVSYGGMDLLRDGPATVTVTGGHEAASATIYRTAVGVHFSTGRPLLIAAIALMVIGYASALLTRPGIRMAVGATAAGLAAILTAPIVTVTRHTFQAVTTGQAARQLHTRADLVPTPPWIAAIHAAPGYWTALGLLCALFLVNVAPAFVRRPAQPAEAVPASDERPGTA